MLIRCLSLLMVLCVVCQGCSWLNRKVIESESLEGVPDYAPGHPERGGVI